MKDFRQQVADIKFWNYFMWAGITVLFVSYVPVLLLLILQMAFGISLPLPQFVLKAMMTMFLFGWVIGYMLIILAGAGVRKRKICSRCGIALTIKELQQMGDRFLCPYCLNTHFQDVAEAECE